MVRTLSSFIIKMPLYTQQQPSKSLADRLFTAEFDDALVDQIHWKNPRYDGCRTTANDVNTVSGLVNGFGVTPVIDYERAYFAYSDRIFDL